MGYTHYWRLRRGGDQRLYSEALIDMAEIIRHSPVALGNAHGEGTGPELSDKHIAFNGRADATCPGDGCGYCGGPSSKYHRPNHDLAHETCYFPTRLADLDGPNPWDSDPAWAFDFTKTAQKPYDVVVTAILCRLAECGPDLVRVSSDGNEIDWVAGQMLASSVLGRPVAIPRNVISYEEVNA